MYRPHPVTDVRVIIGGVEGCLYLTGKSGNRRRGPTRPRSGGLLDPGSRGTHSYPPMLLHKRTFGDPHRCEVPTSGDWGIGGGSFWPPRSENHRNVRFARVIRAPIGETESGRDLSLRGTISGT